MTRDELIATYPDIDINTDGGPDTYQEGLPIVERDPIAIIIKHPTENSFLLADWKQADWKGFVTGGIEDGDSVEDTVRKEILEETGYRHVGTIEQTDIVSHALFFHPVKNVNRLAHYHLVFAQLADLERDETSAAEQAIADFVWVPFDDVEAMLTRKGIKQLWRSYIDQIHS